MVITSLAQPRAAFPAPARVQTSPPPDNFEPGSSAGRLASGIVGGGLAGAGLGLLGARAGAYVGLLIGLETAPTTAGLGQVFLHSLRGAAIGQLAGGALYGAVGIAVGALGATWLYDKATA